jgi:hypothetical protein
MTAVDQGTGEMLPRHDLTELARRFPDQFIEGKDGQPYVAHHVINQRLLQIVGPFDFELVREIRGDVPAVAPDPSARSRRGKAGTPALQGVLVGVVGRLTCEIDGRRTTVEEAGDVGDVHNWPHDGARLKDAASDALKRCAMRLGLALHLWADKLYFLDAQLAAEQGLTEPPAAPQESKPGGANAPQDASPDARADAEPAEGTAPPPGPVADGTPPGFDRLNSPGRIRSWLNGQPEVKAQVEADAKALGLDLEAATLDDLRRLIRDAWSVHQGAAA